MTSRALAVFLLAAFAGAAPDRAGAQDYGPADAFGDAARQAAGANALPPPSALDAVPGYAPQPQLELLGGDPAGASSAGADLRRECERDRSRPMCAASAAFSEAEPWLRRYPLGRGDAVFGGAARGEHPVGLGLDGPPAGACVTVTLAADRDDYERLSCVSGEYAAAESPVAIAPGSGGSLQALSGRDESGVHSIDISTGGRLTHLLYGVHDLALTLSLSDPSAVAEARLVQIRYNDWAFVAVNGSPVFGGPRGGDRLEIRGLQVCTGADTCSSAWDLGRSAQWRRLDIDIRPLLRAGANTVAVRLVHGGHGRLDLSGRIVESAAARDGVRWRDFLDDHPEVRPCAEIEGRDCLQYEVGECLLPSVGGGCAQWEYRYKCLSGEARTELVCEGEDSMYCADGACFDKTAEPTSADEFARSAAMLELARQAGTYLDPDTLRIFTGFPAHCRERAFGLADCCEADAGGAGLSNADLLSALGAQAAGETIRFAGSPHVYDALYAAENLADLQSLLPSAASYAPGLSFFGIKAAYSSASGLVVGFDPASFATAVALAVVRSLLACEQDEQVLALRNGRGLCAGIGSYCSRDTIFGCATEKSGFCCYNSRLARIVAEGGRAQTGRGWGTPPFPDCEGFTAEEIGRIDFSAIDLSEAFGDFAPRHSQELVERFKERAADFVGESSAEDQ